MPLCLPWPHPYGRCSWGTCALRKAPKIRDFKAEKQQRLTAAKRPGRGASGTDLQVQCVFRVEAKVGLQFILGSIRGTLKREPLLNPLLALLNRDLIQRGLYPQGSPSSYPLVYRSRLCLHVAGACAAQLIAATRLAFSLCGCVSHVRSCEPFEPPLTVTLPTTLSPGPYDPLLAMVDRCSCRTCRCCGTAGIPPGWGGGLSKPSQRCEWLLVQGGDSMSKIVPLQETCHESDSDCVGAASRSLLQRKQMAAEQAGSSWQTR